MTDSNERVFDSDTHVIENRDTWTSRLPKKWGDDVMHIEYDSDTATEFWRISGKTVASGWANCLYGAKGETPLQRRFPKTQADVHPACYVPSERLKVMDRWGVETAVLYPNATGFSLEPFLDHPDPKISAAHIRAYNDFLLEEWVAEAPGRFMPMACIAYWDIPEAVREIERIAGKGFGGLVSTGAPQLHDRPFLADKSWDPMWAAAAAAELPIAFHVGNGDTGVHMRPDEDYEIMETRVSTAIYLDNAMQTTDLLLSGVLGRFPDLQFVISESGMGWVPFVLQSCDDRFKRQGIRRPEFGGLLPSELFKRQVHINCFFEEVEEWHFDHVGEHNLMFQTDIPHPTGFYWSGSDDLLLGSIEPTLGKLAPERRQKILWDNAADLYAPALAQQAALC